ncbi:NADH-quinone oxidoreductase subunit NuoE [Candidatus Bipolaricaulota bacterium]|nr:NADH-quinone oxidoreductase subunit NuoE [Candidatus Bipolaricaulota bacterium]
MKLPKKSIDEVLAPFSRRAASVIPILQAIQAEYGYLSEDAVKRTALHACVPESAVFGAATFYSQFRLVPPGEHLVRVCQGTACHVLGGADVLDSLCEELEIDEGGTTADGLFTLESVRCLGCCSLAPAVMIDGETYGRVTRAALPGILGRYRRGDVS